MQPRKPSAPSAAAPSGMPSRAPQSSQQHNLPPVAIPVSHHQAPPGSSSQQLRPQPATARRPSNDATAALASSVHAGGGGSQSARGAQPPISSSLSAISGSSAGPSSSSAGDASGMDGAEAAIRYDSVLTPFEKSEIVEYPQVYFVGQHCQAKIEAPVMKGINFGYDDDRGDYNIVAKDHIAYRYEVLSVLGRGSFGQVVKAIDHKTQLPVALKIIRNKKRFHQQAHVEIKVLSHLRDRDPEGRYGIIKMVEAFEFRCHVCLTYELLSMNLYEYMKMNRFYPLPLTVVKKIGASLLISLAFMWRENIIHCDLKPENILLRQPNRTGVKVIDLGSACFENERIYTYIQSRFYRAPEIILGIGYTKRIDLWSYACVLAELASGYPLFPGESEVEQLACIMEVMGVPPRYLIDASPKKSNFFDMVDGEWAPRLVPNSRKKVRHPSTKTLEMFLGLDSSDPFVDFVQMFLRWDPAERPQPEAAMRHPWICDAYVGVTPKPSVSKRKKGSDAGGEGDATAPLSTSAAGVVQAPPQQGDSAGAGGGGGGGGGGRNAVVPHLPNIHQAKQNPRQAFQQH